MNPPQHEQILRLPDVKNICSLSRSRIYGLIATGSFPKQIKIGRSSGWLRSEISGWMSEKIAERDGQTPGAAK